MCAYRAKPAKKTTAVRINDAKAAKKKVEVAKKTVADTKTKAMNQIHSKSLTKKS